MYLHVYLLCVKKEVFDCFPQEYGLEALGVSMFFSLAKKEESNGYVFFPNWDVSRHQVHGAVLFGIAQHPQRRSNSTSVKRRSQWTRPCLPSYSSGPFNHIVTHIVPWQQNLSPMTPNRPHCRVPTFVIHHIPF